MLSQQPTHPSSFGMPVPVPQPRTSSSLSTSSSLPIAAPLGTPSSVPMTSSPLPMSPMYPDIVPERPVLSRSHASSTSSTGSTSSLFGDAPVDPVTVAGLPHASSRLEARKYKHLSFAEKFLEIAHELDVSTWTTVFDPRTISVEKVAGSLTNAVFFVKAPGVKTLLLRIYGPSSGALISRPHELRILHVLSSQYRIGPRVFGTFANGRVEEFFAASALTAAALREPAVSRWIGARMAELHSVDVDTVDGSSHAPADEGDTWDVAARRNVREWLGAAKDVLELPAATAELRQALDLDAFMATWARYSEWLAAFELRTGKPSPRVFCHNDAQYGNLLQVNEPKPNLPDHRQIIVVDFEYAAPNAAAFDVANHFHEWTADYHGPTPSLLRPELYPIAEQRRNFYAAYLSVVNPEAKVTPPQLDVLDAQVRAWSPASHGMWAIWGVVQAREQLESGAGEVEFDYISYARCRFRLFEEEVARLGA